MSKETKDTQKNDEKLVKVSKHSEKNELTSSKKVTKKSTTKKSTKSTNVKKKSSSSSLNSKKKASSSSKIKKIETPIIPEYYDLPYRYNQTLVRILYQTPKILFVYWDISDEDRLKFIRKYGENFFNETKPILKIYNQTLNYSFEIEINDFANSWYINVNDANCNYHVELGRRPIENSNSNYVYVSSSNNIEFPNDHILFEQLPQNIEFKNVKTNEKLYKDIGSLRLISIKKIYSVHDFYKKMYKDEIFEEISNNHIINPSSSSWN